MTCLALLAVLFLLQPRSPWMLFAAKARCCLHPTCCPPGPLCPFLQSCFAAFWLATCTGAQAYFLPRCWTWHFPLWHLVRLMSARFSNVSMEWCINLSFWFGITCKPDEGMSFGSLMKTLKVLDENETLEYSTGGLAWSCTCATNDNFLSFPSTSLSVYLVHTSSVHQQVFYGLQCCKPC